MQYVMRFITAALIIGLPLASSLSSAAVRITPSVCIKKIDDIDCTDKFSITMQSDEPIDGCVYLLPSAWQENHDRPHSLVCWFKEQSGLYQARLTVSKQQQLMFIWQFKLANGQLEEQFDRLELNILNEIVDRRRKRKRKHIWSFL
jgi:hypothetical protein